MRNTSENKEMRNRHGPFTKYCVTTVACILIAVSAFTFVFFGTDTIAVPSEYAKNSAKNVATDITASRTTREIENNKSNTNLGDINSAPDKVLPGLDPSPNEGVPDQIHISDDEILTDIAMGLYTDEDYAYLVALGGESSSYEGFYAVAHCVLNRRAAGGGSIKDIVTAKGQFAGYHASEVNAPRNDDVRDAAVAALRGGASPVGSCRYFFGRINGYDLWAESDVGEFYNVGNNIYFPTWGKLHNKTSSKSPGAITIYDSASGTWLYPSGSKYP